jgi:hypothetical protein
MVGGGRLWRAAFALSGGGVLSEPDLHYVSVVNATTDQLTWRVNSALN